MEKLIKSALGILNRDNGGNQFEFLAAGVAEREICTNILPSTGPNARGDKGMDARSHATDVEEASVVPFRFYESPKKTSKKIIFAFSIDKDWPAKLKRDLKTIKQNWDKFDSVCFVTNQFIQIKDREDAIKEAKKDLGIDLEIFDGEWLSLKLTDKHYDLAVRYLGMPDSSDPHIKELYERLYAFKEGGMTDKETKRLRELNDRAAHRTGYNGNLNARVRDLQEAARICMDFPDFIEDAKKYLEEALGEIDDADDAWLISDVYYDYFRVLQKLKLHSEIADRLPVYREYLIVHRQIARLKTIFTWCFYLVPHAKDIKIDIYDFASESLQKIESLKTDQEPNHIKAEYDEAILWAKMLLSYAEKIEINILKEWRKHIKRYKGVPLYPLHKLSKVIATMAVAYEGSKEYDDLFNYVQRTLTARNNKLDAAQMTKDRAMALFEAGRYEEAAHYLNEVKIKWYDIETIRGSILSSEMLGIIYTKERLFYAAIYERLTMLHLTTTDKDATEKHKDLFLHGLIELYYSYLAAGKYGTAMIWAILANKAIGEYDPELKSKDVRYFVEGFENQAIMMLSKLKNIAPVFHDRVLKYLKDLGVPTIEIYEELIIEDDEEFKKKFEGESPETFKNANQIRQSIKANKLPKVADGMEPTDESDEDYLIEWSYKGVSFSISVKNSYEGKSVAENIAASLQIICHELFRNDLNWVEDAINIQVKLEADSFNIRDLENPNSLDLEITLSKNDYEQLSQKPFKTVKELEFGLMSKLLELATIDPMDDIKAVLNEMMKGGVFEHLGSKLPFGAPFNVFFSKKEYEEVIHGSTE